MAYVETTELDALLSRVREMRHNPAYPERNAVAYDCYRMFEDLAERYKEECAMRDRCKRQSDSWRDKALELADETHIATLKSEAACPCCRGAELLQPCQECKGTGKISVAYDTLRTHYKTLHAAQLQLANHCEAIKNALRDALDVVEVSAQWLRNAGDDPDELDAAKACDEVVAYARSLGVRRNCPGKDATCPCQDGDACHYEGPNAWPIPNGKPELCGTDAYVETSIQTTSSKESII